MDFVVLGLGILLGFVFTKLVKTTKKSKKSKNKKKFK